MKINGAFIADVLVLWMLLCIGVIAVGGLLDRWWNRCPEGGQHRPVYYAVPTPKPRGAFKIEKWCRDCGQMGARA